MLNIFGSSRNNTREFGYKPRFYDPDKEALDRRIKSRKLQNKSGEITKMRLKQEFSNYRSADAKNTRSSFLSPTTLRLVAIIVFLLVISYFVLDNLLPQFMEFLFPEEHQEYDVLEKYY